MAKANVVQIDASKPAEPTLSLVPEKLPSLKLPKLDLKALMSLQSANLAAASQAQTILVDAAQAIARMQYDYVQQAVADAKVAVGAKSLPKPEAALADVKVAAEKAVAVAKEVVDVAVGAQKQVAELVAQRVQTTVSELKALAA